MKIKIILDGDPEAERSKVKMSYNDHSEFDDGLSISHGIVAVLGAISDFVPGCLKRHHIDEALDSYFGEKEEKNERAEETES